MTELELLTHLVRKIGDVIGVTEEERWLAVKCLHDYKNQQDAKKDKK